MTKKKKTNTKTSAKKSEQKEDLKEEELEAQNTEKQENNEENSNEEPATCDEDIQNLENQIAELKDKHLRLFSEFDNYRKRTSKERVELFKTAHADLMLELLPVLDDFDRAMKSFEDAKDIEAVKEGVKLIHSKLQNTLEKKGLKNMDAQGKDFDTDFHEAITEIPAPTEDLKSKVVDVVEKGYTLNDKVIRFAKVVVGK
jgi:molecular chaperone GrpE